MPMMTMLITPLPMIVDGATEFVLHNLEFSQQQDIESGDIESGGTDWILLNENEYPNTPSRIQKYHWRLCR